MRLYLDEDSASRELVRVLERAGHDVATAHDAGLVGESDPLQMTQAVCDDRICITKNYRDFRQLHILVMQCGGSHPGVFALRSDNDARRDMKSGHVVTAIANLGEILASMRNQLICLNEWR